MNNAEFLQDAIGHIDDALIINAENTVRRRRISPIIAHISAAAAVIFSTASYGLMVPLRTNSAQKRGKEPAARG